MTIPNRITLEDLPTMSIDEINALSGEQLALAEHEACERLRAAKTLYDWIVGAIALKYGDQAQEARRAEGKDTGTVRLQDGPVTVVADLPKRVDWDQAMLAGLVERIRADGADPAEDVDIAFSVPERKYTAWPKDIRQEFEPARTVRTGKPKFRLLLGVARHRSWARATSQVVDDDSGHGAAPWRCDQVSMSLAGVSFSLSSGFSVSRWLTSSMSPSGVAAV